MTLELDSVRSAFALLSGEDPAGDGDRAALCQRLCRDCAARVQARTENREGLDQGALESWAAAEAFYQLTLTDEAGSPESVSADGVQIKEGARSAKARALADEKRRAALGEEGFYFGQA